MPAAYRTSVVNGNTAGTDQTLSIAALLGDLLVVFGSISDFGTVTVTDDAGGTYTRVTSAIWGAGDAGVAYIRNTLVAANATITVTIDNDTNTAVVGSIVAVSGMFRAGSSAVRAHGAGAAKAAATVTATLNRKPLVASNVLVGCCASADTTVTPPTDFTEDQDSSQITPTTALEVVHRNPSASDPSGLATSGAAQWSGLTSTDSVAILIELDSLPITTWAQIGYQQFDISAVAGDYTSGLQGYVPTPGTKAVEIEIVAGGGAGGSGTTVAGAAGGGGASGEWARIWYESSSLITGGAVSVGQGGLGASVAAGGNSSIVIDGITFGAAGGAAGNTSTAVASYGEAVAPALGTVGNTSFDRARGSNASVAAMATSTTSITAYTAGIGGGTPYGLGGRGSGGDANGADGTGYGTGGGGGRRGSTTNRVGGNGANGTIIVREYTNVPTAAEIADAVWDEARAGHVTAGSFGENVIADVTKWNGTAVAAPTTAGVPRVDVKAMEANVVTAAAIADNAIDRATYAQDAKDMFGEVRRNTATAGAASTITLDAGAPATASLFNGCKIYIVGGTGAGQGARRIRAYTAGRVATVIPAWTTVPDATSVFVIVADTGAIEDAGITTNSFNGAVITNAVLATGCITAAKFAAGAVDNSALGTGAISATKFAADAIDSNALAASAVTEIQTGLANSTDVAGINTKLDTIDDFVDTEMAAVLAAVDTEVASIKAQTDQIQFASGLVRVRVDGYNTGQAPLQPTVAGRTLDVTTTGEAGIDLANVGSPSSTLNLSGTTIGAIGVGGIARASFAQDAKDMLGEVRRFTAAGGSATTVTFDGAASTTANFYKGAALLCVGGTGAGQFASITAYSVGRVATLDRTVATAFDATSVFELLASGGGGGGSGSNPFDSIGEDSFTYGDLMRLAIGILAGIASGFDTDTQVYKSLNGTKTRATFTTNETGRTARINGDFT